MKKEFIYNVAGNEYRDTEAFGQAWKAAKAKAIEVHAAIYRTVKKRVRQFVTKSFIKAVVSITLNLLLMKT